MRLRHTGAALLGVAALLLVPAVGSAQVNLRINPYYGGGFPSAYNYGMGYASPYAGTYGYYYPGTTWAGTYGSYYPGATWSGAYGSYYPGMGSGYTGYYPGYAYSVYSGGYPRWTYGSSVWGSTYPSYYSPPGSYLNPSTTYGYATDAGGNYSYGSAASPSGNGAALLNVRLPDSNAEVWVEGQQTRQRGTWREYVSPPLNPDRNYTYDVRARWMDNGREVERTRTVPVQANGVATVDFTAPENKARVEDNDRGNSNQHPAGQAKPDGTGPKDVKPRDVKPGDNTRPPDRRPGDTDRPPPP